MGLMPLGTLPTRPLGPSVTELTPPVPYARFRSREDCSTERTAGSHGVDSFDRAGHADIGGATASEATVLPTQ